MKVNFYFVWGSGAGECDRLGVECDVCGERFFDVMSFSGGTAKVLESCIPVAIEHANAMHESRGGRFKFPAATALRAYFDA